MDGPDPTYNIPVVARLTGDPDRTALRAALRDVIARHEVLRTVFTVVDGEPYQEILGSDEVAWQPTFVDVAANDVAAEVARMATCTFDLTTEPPIRVWLLSVNAREHVLVVVLHHIAGDGWSWGPLGRDIALAYADRRAGRAPEWAAPLPAQYADYALWQRELLGTADNPDSVLARQVGFWREALAGVPEELELPVDRPRPAVASRAGHSVPVEVSSELHGRLVELARLGAGTDIPIGSAVAGRTDEGLDELVGCFVNTLVVRTDLSGDPAFRDVLGRVRETGLAAFGNQDVPFERLVEELAPARSLARHPLFQVMLTLQNTGRAALDLPGLGVGTSGAAAGLSVAQPARFDLDLALTEVFDEQGCPAGLRGVVVASADLFDPDTVETIAARWVRVLGTLVANAGVRLDAVDVLDDDERSRVLVTWNDTAMVVPEVPVAELFAARVAEAPAAIAVVSGDSELSYGELGGRVHRLARRLIGLGVGPEAVLAVVLGRDSGLMTALLGVSAAGAAYLAIDPTQPVERIAYMLDDATPVLVVTDSVNASHIPAAWCGERGAVLVLDEPVVVTALESEPSSPVGDADRLVPLSGSHPAYVVYTSGSTGQPKGVVVSQAGFANTVAAGRGRFRPEENFRIAQFTSIGFDVFCLEWALALVSGAALVVVPDERRLGDELARFLVEQAITHRVSGAKAIPRRRSLPFALGAGYASRSVVGVVAADREGFRQVPGDGPLPSERGGPRSRSRPDRPV
ncbi:condensation domain-containing protein [Embleya sp. NPDC020630]|uniref:condensation domain-containing protein n=1 Tax=Embleya sp. NPDC020630 TaxID=3363979 RepID=UPI0037B5E282